MNNSIRSLSPLALALVTVSAATLPNTGCGAMAMDRGPLGPPPSDAELVVDDSEIAEALARRPQLPADARVGVYFTRPMDGEVSWRWSFEEREALVEASAELEGITLFPLTEGVDGDDLRQLRVAAARNGADAVLVVRGRPEQETSDNGWLATYPLLLPILFAPAQELTTHFSVEAAMYDVRNGFLYLAVESEGFEDQQRAHLWIDREGGVETAKQHAIRDLSSELTERLAHLVSERVARAAEAAQTSGSTDVTGALPEGTPEPAAEPEASPAAGVEAS